MWSYIFYKGYREAVHTFLSSSGGVGLFKKQQSMHNTPEVLEPGAPFCPSLCWCESDSLSTRNAFSALGVGVNWKTRH